MGHGLLLLEAALALAQRSQIGLRLHGVERLNGSLRLREAGPRGVGA